MNGQPLNSIPLRNVWHMFLYAWDLLDERQDFDAVVENAPGLSLLLASLLAPR